VRVCLRTRSIDLVGSHPSCCRCRRRNRCCGCCRCIDRCCRKPPSTHYRCCSGRSAAFATSDNDDLRKAAYKRGARWGCRCSGRLSSSSSCSAHLCCSSLTTIVLYIGRTKARCVWCTHADTCACARIAVSRGGWSSPTERTTTDCSIRQLVIDKWTRTSRRSFPFATWSVGHQNTVLRVKRYVRSSFDGSYWRSSAGHLWESHIYIYIYIYIIICLFTRTLCIQ